MILVGFDGFGHDYFDRFETPNFDRIAAAGVKADALIPPFPSLTFPSFYSIATGMYPEHHGIVGNRVYDPDLDEIYSYQEPETVRDGRWYGGQPIWVTAETQGMVAAAYFIPGTEAAIQGVRPTFWTPYDSSVPNQARVEHVLAWLELPPRERPHLITLYFSTVDRVGHAFGPGSSQVRSAVEMVDRMLGRLVSGIQRLPYGDRVCLVLVSDHGMTTPRRDSYYAIVDAVDLRGVRSVKTGPNLSLFVPAGRGRAERLRDELNVVLPHGPRVPARGAAGPLARSSEPTHRRSRRRGRRGIRYRGSPSHVRAAQRRARMGSHGAVHARHLSRHGPRYRGGTKGSGLREYPTCTRFSQPCSSCGPTPRLTGMPRSWPAWYDLCPVASPGPHLMYSVSQLQ